jgi:DNA-binding response OmpR family regulator
MSDNALPRSACIAVVDDDPRIRGLLEEELSDEGYKSESFSDGFLLLEKISALSIDLILLDLMMPQLDGIETLKRLRRVGCDIPVVIFTALSDNDKRRQAEAEGANEYILKPDLFENLSRIVERNLDQNQENSSLV